MDRNGLLVNHDLHDFCISFYIFLRGQMKDILHRGLSCSYEKVKNCQMRLIKVWRKCIDLFIQGYLKTNWYLLSLAIALSNTCNHSIRYQYNYIFWPGLYNAGADLCQRGLDHISERMEDS